MNPSPLRFPGGKYKIYKYIEKLIEINNCSTYCEPFAGGSAISIELLLKNKVNKIILNDYDYSIYCFWYSVLNNTDDLIHLIQETEINILNWKKQKKIRDNVYNHDKLTVGFSTFFLNRTNRSGIIDKAGPIGGFNQKSDYSIDCRFNKIKLIDKIEKIAKLKDKIELYNYDALDFIDIVLLKKRNVFTFFDPPYYRKGRGLYTNFYNHGDHQNLSKHILYKLKNRKWIVTYDNHEAIRKMYNSKKIIQFSLNYSLQNKIKAQEIMVYSSKVISKENDTCLL